MQRQASGILVIDKPVNTTSAQAVAIVKKTFNLRKVGHTGTLDPFATGVLVCCINNATRLSDFLIKDKKKYAALLHLGIETDTQDLSGQIISECNEIYFTEEKIRAAFQLLEGISEQVPPAYSALKHNGVPLYKLARSGNPIQKAPRPVNIESIKILNINLPEIHFEVVCSSGTYIRTLGADIGTALGCGAYLKKLKRLENNGFPITSAINLTQIKKIASSEEADKILSENLVVMTDIPLNMPFRMVSDTLSTMIKHGNIITEKHIPQKKIENKTKLVKIIDKDNNLIAILNYDNKTKRYKYCCVFTS